MSAAFRAQKRDVDFVIRVCPKCGQRNRIPVRSLTRGRYTCGACGATVARRTHPPGWLAALTALWVLLLAVVGVSNAIGPEYTWIGAANLYLPQWIYAAPAILLVPAYLLVAPRWTLLPAACVLYVAGPLMGFTWTFPPTIPRSSRVPVLRVMTYNAKWGRHGADLVAAEIRRANPDLVQFQDSSGLTNSAVGGALAGYTVRVDGQYIVASKYPISEITSCDDTVLGMQHHVTRVWMRLGRTGVAVYDVHLISPRTGLVAIRHDDIRAIVHNTLIRIDQARRLAWYLSGEHGPLIVTGDFNSPVQGLALRCETGLGLRDAFEQAGRGYGYTYGQDTRVGRPYVRIDHILVSRHFTVTDCWTGGSRASEHSPVCAVLALTNPRN